MAMLYKIADQLCLQTMNHSLTHSGEEKKINSPQHF